MMTPPGISRRRFLGSASGAALGLGLSSCGSPPIPYTGPATLQRKRPNDIVVDAHCHVFNGQDIDIAAYALALTRERGGLVGYAVLREVVAAYLIAMRELAPCITEELEQVHKVVDEVKGLPYHSHQRVDRVQAELVRVFGTRNKNPDTQRAKCTVNINYTRSSQLVNMLFFGAPRLGGSRKARMIMDRFEEALHDTRDSHGNPIGRGSITDQVRGMLRQVDKEAGYLLAHFVNYRTVNAYELWRQYAQHFNPQNVDLFMAASLDMNSWLCASRKTGSTGFQGDRSYMRMQVDLMEQIAVLFGGDIMPMAGWCPRFSAEVENRFFLDRKDPSHCHNFEKPLDTLRDAVMHRGHLGAKLYPPMGFRPYGNAQLDMEKPGRAFNGMDSEHAVRAFPDHQLGHYLDAELKKLYTWCVETGVPVMAHTGPSHGSQLSYAERANPDFWKAVLDPRTADQPANLGLHDLRVNLAHLGCWHPDSFWDRLMGGSENGRWGDAIMHMTAKYPHVYSDLADMSDIGTSGWKDKFDSAFTRWNAYPTTSSKNRTSRKMMYGSDWFVMAQADVFREDDKQMEQDPPDLSRRVGRTYHLRWAEFLGQQGCKHRYDSSDIMGHNAMRYLGMDTQRGRDRVDTFFDRHGMQKPVWRRKLDAQVKAGLV